LPLNSDDDAASIAAAGVCGAKNGLCIPPGVAKEEDEDGRDAERDGAAS
jgi:hypothetical protein